MEHADLKEAVRKAMRRGRGVEEAVRRITLTALTRGRLDRPTLTKVTRLALGAVHSAARTQGEASAEAVRQGVAGVERALAQAAQALELTLEEARSRAGDFSRKELVRAREDLADLRDMYLATLRATARAARGTAAAMLKDAVRHAETGGAALGRAAGDAKAVPAQLLRAGRERFADGLAAAATSGALLAQVAAGVLSGIAGAAKTRRTPRSR